MVETDSSADLARGLTVFNVFVGEACAEWEPKPVRDCDVAALVFVGEAGGWEYITPVIPAYPGNEYPGVKNGADMGGLQGDPPYPKWLFACKNFAAETS